MPFARRTTPALAALLLAVTTAGCGVSSDEEPSAQDTVTVTASPTPTPTPSPSPTPSETATPTPTTTASAPPEASFLTADEVPGLNDEVGWKLRRTGPIASRPFGLCAKVDMLSIGAEQAVERVFVPDLQDASSTDTAAQEVVTFPDTTTAARVGKVLRAWHRTCARQVRGQRVNVRPIEAVPVGQGQGWWYLVSYVRGGEGRFHAFGVVANGTRMSLLRMDNTGQDRNYEPGQDPMQLAVKAAAAKLG